MWPIFSIILFHFYIYNFFGCVSSDYFFTVVTKVVNINDMKSPIFHEKVGFLVYTVYTVQQSCTVYIFIINLYGCPSQKN